MKTETSSEIALKYKRKFPRIGHLPNSKGLTKDDRKNDIFCPSGPILMTEKMDGECTVIGYDYVHARSLDSDQSAKWRRDINYIARKLFCNIPPEMRIIGENLYACHSIRYSHVPLFQVFMITDKFGVLSWEETMEWCELLNLETVPVILNSAMPRGLPERVWKDAFNEEHHEGYVLRNADEFLEADWDENIAKYVRANHVQTDEHWTKKWEKNEVYVSGVDKWH